MDEEIVDRATAWEPVAGSVDLRSLARDEFSGAVTAGLAWAFLLNGRVVGLFDGDLDDFEGGDLSAYRAPDPALPLLCAMQETGGETRGKYYSEETSLREVDRTLSSGNFTGYVELSENVLSGDYYVVYHGGRSMSVAFVGASRRLVTGDEAFDLADDEVGIFAVNAVEVTVTDLPEAEETGAATGGVADADEEGDANADGNEDADPADTGQESVTFGASDSADEDGDAADAATGPDTTNPDRYDGLTGDMGIGLGSADDTSASSAETDAETDANADVEAGSVDGGDGVAEVDERADEGQKEGVESGGFGEAEGIEADDVDGDAGVEASGTDGDEEIGADDGETAAGGAFTPTEAGAASPPEDGEEAPDEDRTDVGDEEDAGDEATSDEDEPVTGREGPETTPATNGVSPDGPGDGTSADGVEPTSAAASERASNERDGNGDNDADGVDDSDAGDSWSVVGRSESGVFSAERQWQQTKRIPALAPEDSIEREEGATVGGADVGAHDGGGAEASDASTSADSDGPVADPTDEDTAAEATTGAGEKADPEARIEQRRAERDELASAVESLESEVTGLESDLESVTRERDRLRAQVADLESELATLREAAEREGEPDTQRLSPAAAREGTNLFVRYRSKGKPTLKKAQAGEAKQKEVVENLRLEYHTTFDSERATVDGESYETFLRGTTEWGFTNWVVEELLYEIGRSGHRVDLAPLFDAIPEIDRIEFDGTVPVTVDDEEGGQSHESRAFDLVFRNSMGDPLFVVDVDTSRDATTQGMVGSLIEGARAVGESKDTLGGAFYVTTSFFEPGALDAVGEATKSGLLSRSSKKSFVKLSRKQGYHLCLVEARDGEFHLTVPEL